MQVQPRYCNICNIKIPNADFESGKAIQYENYYYCANCKPKAMKIIEAWKSATKDAPDPAKTKRRLITRKYSSKGKGPVPHRTAPREKEPGSRRFPAQKPDKKKPRPSEKTTRPVLESEPTEVLQPINEEPSGPAIDDELPLVDYTDLFSKKKADEKKAPPPPKEPQKTFDAEEIPPEETEAMEPVSDKKADEIIGKKPEAPKEEDLKVDPDELKIKPEPKKPEKPQPTSKSQRFNYLTRSMRQRAKAQESSLSDAEKTSILEELGIGTGQFAAITDTPPEKPPAKEPAKKKAPTPAPKTKPSARQDTAKPRTRPVPDSRKIQKKPSTRQMPSPRPKTRPASKPVQQPAHKPEQKPAPRPEAKPKPKSSRLPSQKPKVKPKTGHVKPVAPKKPESKPKPPSEKRPPVPVQDVLADVPVSDDVMESLPTEEFTFEAPKKETRKPEPKAKQMESLPTQEMEKPPKREKTRYEQDFPTEIRELPDLDEEEELDELDEVEVESVPDLIESDEIVEQGGAETQVDVEPAPKKPVPKKKAPVAPKKKTGIKKKTAPVPKKESKKLKPIARKKSGVQRPPSVKRTRAPYRKKKSKAPVLIILLLILAGGGYALYHFNVGGVREILMGKKAGNTGTSTQVETSPGTGASTSTDSGTGVETGKKTGTQTDVAPVDTWEKDIAVIKERVDKIAENPEDYDKLIADIQDLRTRNEDQDQRVEILDEQATIAEKTFETEAEKAATKAVNLSEEKLSSGRFAEALAAVADSKSFYKNTETWKEKTAQVFKAAARALQQYRDYEDRKDDFTSGLSSNNLNQLRDNKSALEKYDAFPADTEAAKEVSNLVKRYDSAIEKLEQRLAMEKQAFEAAKREAERLADDNKLLRAASALEAYAGKQENEYADQAREMADNYRETYSRNLAEDFPGGRRMVGWEGSRAFWNNIGGEISGSSKTRSAIYKGLESWHSYELSFKIRIQSGVFALSLAAKNNSITMKGYEFLIPGYICDPARYYEVTAVFDKGELRIKSDLSGPVETLVKVGEDSGKIGFVLTGGGKVSIKDISFKLNE